jgi:hypothetical protein
MKIDSVLVMGAWIRHVVGKAGNPGEFEPARSVQIGVAETAIDGVMSDTETGEAGAAVGADRDVTRRVDHEVVDPFVPLQSQCGMFTGIGIMLALRLATIKIEPPMTRKAISRPKARATILFVCSGPVPI